MDEKKEPDNPDPNSGTSTQSATDPNTAKPSQSATDQNKQDGQSSGTQTSSKEVLVKAEAPPKQLKPLPELPLPKPKDMAKELGILPMAKDFAIDFLRRHEYLDYDKIGKWMVDHHCAHMPEQGKDICGVCTSNFGGYPMEGHDMKYCPIPIKDRLKFMSTNTASVCLKCFGRSNCHDACRREGKMEQCRQCELKGKPGRFHTPLLGICDITDQEVAENIQQFRIEHYRGNMEKSAQRPFQFVMVNDEPLRTAYDSGFPIFGFRALIDKAEQYGGLQYEQGATYEGLIEKEDFRKRNAVSMKIEQLRRSYYLTNNPRKPLPPTIQAKVNAYKEVLQWNDQVRLEEIEEERQARAKLKEKILARQKDGGSPTTKDIDQNKFNKQGKVDQVDQTTTKLTQPESGSDLKVREKTPTLEKLTENKEWNEKVDEFIREWKEITEDVKETPSAQNSGYFMSPEEKEKKWWVAIQARAFAIKGMEEPMIEVLRARLGGRTWFEGPWIEPERWPVEHLIVKNKIKETLIKVYRRKEMVDQNIIEVQTMLTGYNDAEFLSNNPDQPRSAKDEYLNLLIQLAIGIHNDEKVTKACLTQEHQDLSCKQGRDPYERVLIPDFRGYLNVPPKHREGFFFLYVSNSMKEVNYKYPQLWQK